MDILEAMDPSEALGERRKVYFDGDEVEVWENPDIHFGATPADLKGYYYEGSWVALFNAMTLASRPDSHA